MDKVTWRKQSVFLWMFLALLALGTGQVLGLVLSPEPEETLKTEEISAPLILTGTVILEGTPVEAPAVGFWSQSAAEGKVSVGQTLFTGPGGTEDASQEVRLLSGALTTEKLALPRRRENLHEAISGLTTGENDIIDVMALVLEDAPEEALAAARDRLSALASQNQKVTAPVGGILVAQREGQTLGRIITSDCWEITLELPFQAAVGDRLAVELLCGIFQKTELVVAHVERTETGCRVGLFCQEYLEDVAKIRNLTVKILSE